MPKHFRQLTPKQYAILAAMLHSSRQLSTKEVAKRLLKLDIEPWTYGKAKNVHVQMSYVRAALRCIGVKLEVLKTYKGQGYTLTPAQRQAVREKLHLIYTPKHAAVTLADAAFDEDDDYEYVMGDVEDEAVDANPSEAQHDSE